MTSVEPGRATLPGCGVLPGWCREDPVACRVGSEGLKQRGRQPIRRGVRGGSPALELRALLTLNRRIPTQQAMWWRIYTPVGAAPAVPTDP